MFHVSNNYNKLSVIWTIHTAGKSRKDILKYFATNIVTQEKLFLAAPE